MVCVSGHNVTRNEKPFFKTAQREREKKNGAHIQVIHLHNECACVFLTDSKTISAIVCFSHK